jgi:hypothetical protein
VITKVIQLLMVCAIFNPFCCCTAGVLDVHDSEPAPAAHRCCQSQQSQLPDAPLGCGSDDGHDPSDCPHQALKDYKASIGKDAAVTHDAVSLFFALWAVFDCRVLESAAQSQFPVDVATASQAPPLSFAQVYCVYRI